jgi:hypothetical protein
MQPSWLFKSINQLTPSVEDYYLFRLSYFWSEGGLHVHTGIGVTLQSLSDSFSVYVLEEVTFSAAEVKLLCPWSSSRSTEQILLFVHYFGCIVSLPVLPSDLFVGCKTQHVSMNYLIVNLTFVWRMTCSQTRFWRPGLAGIEEFCLSVIFIHCSYFISQKSYLTSSPEWTLCPRMKQGAFKFQLIDSSNSSR